MVHFAAQMNYLNRKFAVQIWQYAILSSKTSLCRETAGRIGRRPIARKASRMRQRRIGEQNKYGEPYAATAHRRVREAYRLQADSQLQRRMAHSRAPQNKQTKYDSFGVWFMA